MNISSRLLGIIIEINFLIISLWISFWFISKSNLINIIHETRLNIIKPIELITIMFCIFYTMKSCIYIPGNFPLIYILLTITLIESWENMVIVVIVIYFLTEKISIIKNYSQEIMQLIDKTINRIFMEQFLEY
ncbi:hypothetical protein QKC54_gp0968 [Megavirus baoshan]|uniref:Transmembrane protein n=1 Tax=Megavirus baoshan TaxID=2496520 RepID=A0A3Q8U8H2_9VIRU|nr:hypothetical protein QKC54_gp0968 [Megavirus baoshan]AZL89635.1 hypothetical protein Mb0104 [Megavirus baoshan]